MARNSEKAMTKLARFYKMKMEEGTGKGEKRPYLASDCHDLKKAETWRRELISDISKKISQIQNPGLGEFRIRDLNDEINKLIRVKYHWERRLRELGGPGYRFRGACKMDRTGVCVPGTENTGGYRYFGAAKDLPGVRELFETEPPPPPRRTRGELMRFVDADYYGYRDDDDGLLIPLEKEAELKAVKAAVEAWKQQQLTGTSQSMDTEDDSIQADLDELEGELDEVMPLTEPLQKFVAHVPDIPSQEDVQASILQAKKMELLKQYASEEMILQAEESRQILGYSK